MKRQLLPILLLLTTFILTACSSSAPVSSIVLHTKVRNQISEGMDRTLVHSILGDPQKTQVFENISQDGFCRSQSSDDMVDIAILHQFFCQH